MTRYELAKVRILNGAHSALAYFGLLAGHTKIDQAAADPRLSPVVRLMLLDEVLPTLAPPPGLDLERYVDNSLARFTNGQLGYTTQKWQRTGPESFRPYRRHHLRTVSWRARRSTAWRWWSPPTRHVCSALLPADWRSPIRHCIA